MKLKKPNLSSLTFERTLDDEFSYLADGESVFFRFECNAGGYLNPKLQEAVEDIRLNRKVARLAMTADQKEDQIKRSEEIDVAAGTARFEAIYAHCVMSWDTNIIDDDTGKPLQANKENFMFLAEADNPAISKVLVELATFVENTAQFMLKADEEAEKN